MGVKRVVDVEFWGDDRVMDMTPEDKLFFLYLMTNPHTTQLGIYHINKKQMAFELGYSMDTVTNLIDRFEEYGVIRYSEETSEVAIKNYLRHSIVKGGKPVEDLLIKEISKVKDKSLLRFVYGCLSGDENLNESVASILEMMNVNDNDNENEDSYHESLTNRPTNRTTNRQTTRFTPPTPDEVRLFCQSKGYQIDVERFIDFYTSKGWMIGKNHMKDWRAAVRNWARRDREEKTKPQNYKSGFYSEDRIAEIERTLANRS